MLTPIFVATHFFGLASMTIGQFSTQSWIENELSLKSDLTFKFVKQSYSRKKFNGLAGESQIGQYTVEFPLFKGSNQAILALNKSLSLDVAKFKRTHVENKEIFRLEVYVRPRVVAKHIISCDDYFYESLGSPSLGYAVRKTKSFYVQNNIVRPLVLNDFILLSKRDEFLKFVWRARDLVVDRESPFKPVTGNITGEPNYLPGYASSFSWSFDKKGMYWSIDTTDTRGRFYNFFLTWDQIRPFLKPLTSKASSSPKTPFRLDWVRPIPPGNVRQLLLGNNESLKITFTNSPPPNAEALLNPQSISNLTFSNRNEVAAKEIRLSQLFWALSQQRGLMREPVLVPGERLDIKHTSNYLFWEKFKYLRGEKSLYREAIKSILARSSAKTSVLQISADSISGFKDTGSILSALSESAILLGKSGSNPHDAAVLFGQAGYLDKLSRKITLTTSNIKVGSKTTKISRVNTILNILKFVDKLTANLAVSRLDATDLGEVLTDAVQKGISVDPELVSAAQDVSKMSANDSDKVLDALVGTFSEIALDKVVDSGEDYLIGLLAKTLGPKLVSAGLVPGAAIGFVQALAPGMVIGGVIFDTGGLADSMREADMALGAAEELTKVRDGLAPYASYSPIGRDLDRWALSVYFRALALGAGNDAIGSALEHGRLAKEFAEIVAWAQKQGSLAEYTKQRKDWANEAREFAITWKLAKFPWNEAVPLVAGPKAILSPKLSEGQSCQGVIRRPTNEVDWLLINDQPHKLSGKKWVPAMSPTGLLGAVAKPFCSRGNGVDDILFSSGEEGGEFGSGRKQFVSQIGLIQNSNSIVLTKQIKFSESAIGRPSIVHRKGKPDLLFTCYQKTGEKLPTWGLLQYVGGAWTRFYVGQAPCLYPFVSPVDLDHDGNDEIVCQTKDFDGESSVGHLERYPDIGPTQVYRVTDTLERVGELKSPIAFTTWFRSYFHQVPCAPWVVYCVEADDKRETATSMRLEVVNGKVGLKPFDLNSIGYMLESARGGPRRKDGTFFDQGLPVTGRFSDPLKLESFDGINLEFINKSQHDK